MAMADRIRAARRLRGLTQQALGEMLGFPPGNADVRIAQYESGVRRPRRALLQRMAALLDVSWEALSDPVAGSEEDIVRTLFSLEDAAPVYIAEPAEPDGRCALYVDLPLVDRALREWARRRQELETGEITQEEYLRWRLSWPDTSELRGRHAHIKPWREEDRSDPPGQPPK